MIPAFFIECTMMKEIVSEGKVFCFCYWIRSCALALSTECVLQGFYRPVPSQRTAGFAHTLAMFMGTHTSQSLANPRRDLHFNLCDTTFHSLTIPNFLTPIFTFSHPCWMKRNNGTGGSLALVRCNCSNKVTMLMKLAIENTEIDSEVSFNIASRGKVRWYRIVSVCLELERINKIQQDSTVSWKLHWLCLSKLAATAEDLQILPIDREPRMLCRRWLSWSSRVGPGLLVGCNIRANGTLSSL